MKTCFLVLLAAVSIAVTAGAQEFPNEPHEFLMARLAAEEGRFDEALERLDRVIAKNPGDPILLYERAMVLADSGRVDRAETELRSVVSKAPDFYDANRVLGRLLLDRAGTNRMKVEEALVFLQAAYKANPDDLSTGMVVSQILGSLGRTDEAERILASLVERAPDQRSLNYNYAQMLTKLGRGDESKKYLEKTVSLDATFVPAVMQLVDIYQQEGEWQKAADLLQPLVSDDPMNLELQRQQAYFYLRAGASAKARDRLKALTAADPKDMRTLFYLGESLNDLEDYAEAEKIFRQVLAAEPNDPDVLASFGLSLAGQKKWDESSSTFNRLLTVPQLPDPLAALARTQLAFIDLQKGNYEAAVETARSIFVFRDKPNTQAINIALEALKKQKKSAEAVTLLEPLTVKFKDDPFINARYVEALARAGMSAQAQKHAAVQAALGARNAVATSEAYMQAGDQPAAIALLRSAAATRPEDVDLQFQLGSLYERTGDRKAAEQTFLALLDKHPEHAPTLNYLGYMWAEKGVNLERAQAMLTRAVGQEPENGAYVDSLGWVYYQQGKLELAEKYLTDATRLLPRDATVHEHLGDVVAQRGDAQRALALYRTAVDLDPDSKDIEKLRSKIAQLERAAQTTQR